MRDFLAAFKRYFEAFEPTQYMITVTCFVGDDKLASQNVDIFTLVDFAEVLEVIHAKYGESLRILLTCEGIDRCAMMLDCSSIEYVTFNVFQEIRGVYYIGKRPKEEYRLQEETRGYYEARKKLPLPITLFRCPGKNYISIVENSVLLSVPYVTDIMSILQGLDSDTYYRFVIKLLKNENIDDVVDFVLSNRPTPDILVEVPEAYMCYRKQCEKVCRKIADTYTNSIKTFIWWYENKDTLTPKKIAYRLFNDTINKVELTSTVRDEFLTIYGERILRDEDCEAISNLIENKFNSIGNIFECRKVHETVLVAEDREYVTSAGYYKEYECRDYAYLRIFDEEYSMWLNEPYKVCDYPD